MQLTCCANLAYIALRHGDALACLAACANASPPVTSQTAASSSGMADDSADGSISQSARAEAALQLQLAQYRAAGLCLAGKGSDACAGLEEASAHVAVGGLQEGCTLLNEALAVNLAVARSQAGRLTSAGNGSGAQSKAAQTQAQLLHGAQSLIDLAVGEHASLQGGGCVADHALSGSAVHACQRTAACMQLAAQCAG